MIFTQSMPVVIVWYNKRYYRYKSSWTYEINLIKYCHTKWQGCTQFGSTGCGVSKAERKWAVIEKGKEEEGSWRLNLVQISNCWDALSYNNLWLLPTLLTKKSSKML